MSYVRPSSTAAFASWVGEVAYTRPAANAAKTDWLEGEIREPLITATSSASGASLAWAVSVGSSAGTSTADGTHSERTPEPILGSAFVIGTGNAAGVTKGDAFGAATAQAVGGSIIRSTGTASGVSSAFAHSLIWLTSTGTASGSSIADGRGIFNKDFAGKCLAGSSVQGRSLVTATSTGYCFGRASVLSNYRPRARVQRPAVPTFSTDGRATGTSFGRATVGRKQKWRKVPVLIPQFGNPAVGNIKASSRASGVSAHG